MIISHDERRSSLLFQIIYESPQRVGQKDHDHLERKSHSSLRFFLLTPLKAKALGQIHRHIKTPPFIPAQLTIESNFVRSKFINDAMQPKAFVQRVHLGRLVTLCSHF